MLEETPAAQMLRGLRGQGPFDIKAAAQAISAFSRFGAATVDTIAAAEINPLIVLKQGAIGVDVVIEAHQEGRT
jgi:acetate---CoA ligase (ADP-forming)